MDRERRRKGDKSKNCRMATVYVVYTLKVHPDGTVEGPLNRQVFAAGNVFFESFHDGKVIPDAIATGSGATG